MKELIKRFLRLNNYWITPLLIIVGLYLDFLAFGQQQGLRYFLYFAAFVLVASLVVFSFVVGRKNTSLENELQQSRLIVQDLRERNLYLENEKERIQSEVREQLDQLVIARVIDIIRQLINDVETTRISKEIADKVGVTRFVITSIALGESEDKVCATVGFKDIPPFKLGQRVIVHLRGEEVVGIGQVSLVDERTAFVEFSRGILTESLIQQLDLFSKLTLDNSYVQLPFRKELQSYDIEKLETIATQLKNTYDILIEIVQGG